MTCFTRTTSGGEHHVPLLRRPCVDERSTESAVSFLRSTLISQALGVKIDRPHGTWLMLVHLHLFHFAQCWSHPSYSKASLCAVWTNVMGMRKMIWVMVCVWGVCRLKESKTAVCLLFTLRVCRWLSNDWKLMNNEFEWMWKEATLA